MNNISPVQVKKNFRNDESIFIDKPIRYATTFIIKTTILLLFRYIYDFLINCINWGKVGDV